MRQYRPALEAFTWELPAGLVDPGEDPPRGCRRELLEETGYLTRMIHPLGMPPPAPAASVTASILTLLRPASASRISCPSPVYEELATPSELVAMIKLGEFMPRCISAR